MTLLKEHKYTVIGDFELDNTSHKVLSLLYAPLIGSISVSLYLNFYYTNRNSALSHDYLMYSLTNSLDEIYNARTKLEAVGLLNVHVKDNNYVYEVFDTLTPKDFFNHPLLGELLKNYVNEDTYNYLLNSFKTKVTNLKGFVNITKSFTDVYKVAAVFDSTIVNLQGKNSNNIVVNKTIDFDIIKSALSTYNLNKSAFSEEKMDAITKTAYIYNLDEIKIIDLIKLTLDDRNMIDVDLFREKARVVYNFENSKKPTVVSKKSDIIIDNEIKDEKLSAFIYACENLSINEFLESKQMGIANSRDLKIIETAMFNNNLSIPVMNVIVDYSLTVCDNKLQKNFIEAVCGHFSRSKIKTAYDAAMLCKKEQAKHKEYNKVGAKKAGYSKKSKDEVLPTWTNKEITITKTNEMDDIFSDYIKE